MKETMKQHLHAAERKTSCSGVARVIQFGFVNLEG